MDSPNRNIFDLGCLLLLLFFFSEVATTSHRCIVLVVFFPFKWSFWSLVIIKPGGNSYSSFVVAFLFFSVVLFARFLGVGFAANSGANKLRFVRLACGANFVVVFFTEARRKKEKYVSGTFVFVFDALSI